MEKGYAFLWNRLDTRSAYFWGVGIGLIIAWVTSGLAYLKGSDQSPVLLDLIILEFVVSVILMAVALIINTKRKAGKN